MSSFILLLIFAALASLFIIGFLLNKEIQGRVDALHGSLDYVSDQVKAVHESVEMDANVTASIKANMSSTAKVNKRLHNDTFDEVGKVHDVLTAHIDTVKTDREDEKGGK